MTPSTRRAIITSHHEGYTPEGIVRLYPLATLAEVREVCRVEDLNIKRARERRRTKLLVMARQGLLET